MSNIYFKKLETIDEMKQFIEKETDKYTILYRIYRRLNSYI